MDGYICREMGSKYIKIIKMSDKLCEYGCNNEFKFLIGKFKKKCCSKTFHGCPEVKRKNIKSNIGKHNQPPYIRTDEHRKKMSILVSGEKNGFFGKTFSKETKEKFSKDRTGSGNSQYGKIGRISGNKNPMWGKGYLIEGSKNPAWKGGLCKGKKSKYAQGFNKTLKEKIRKKYDYKCAICKKPDNQVHHIDYNKFNHDESNLINLCKSCHSKTNFNREYWRKYFERFK